MSKSFLREFCHTSNLDCILDKIICYKNPKNPSSIEMVLTYKKERFLKDKAIETGFSDFNKMAASIFKQALKNESLIQSNIKNVKPSIVINLGKASQNNKYDRNKISFREYKYSSGYKN